MPNCMEGISKDTRDHLLSRLSQRLARQSVISIMMPGDTGTSDDVLVKHRLHAGKVARSNLMPILRLKLYFLKKSFLVMFSTSRSNHTG